MFFFLEKSCMIFLKLNFKANWFSIDRSAKQLSRSWSVKALSA
jgi:hypothetical protein